MKRTTTNKMMKRLAVMAILITGLVLTGASLTNAQDCIKIDDKTKTHKEISSTTNRDCWVNRAKSGDKNLEYAYLKNADLTGAILAGAKLTYAYLSKAILTKADLTGANLERAMLNNADLKDAVLKGANFTNANLVFANLTDAYLRKAVLTNAKIIKSESKGIDIEDWKKRGGIFVD